jgi:hypothetical protein
MKDSVIRGSVIEIDVTAWHWRGYGEMPCEHDPDATECQRSDASGGYRASERAGPPATRHTSALSIKFTDVSVLSIRQFRLLRPSIA